MSALAAHRRLIACQWACEGIPTTELIIGPEAVFELIDALQNAMDILSRAESNASGNPEFDYVAPRVRACRAALAKVAA